MPEKRFMPRRLHKPVPLVWNLTAAGIGNDSFFRSFVGVYHYGSNRNFLDSGSVIMGIVLAENTYFFSLKHGKVFVEASCLEI